MIPDASFRQMRPDMMLFEQGSDEECGLDLANLRQIDLSRKCTAHIVKVQCCMEFGYATRSDGRLRTAWYQLLTDYGLRWPPEECRLCQYPNTPPFLYHGHEYVPHDCFSYIGSEQPAVPRHQSVNEEEYILLLRTSTSAL